MADTLTLNFTVAEAQAIAQILGQLPTSSGAWPLLQKVLGQIKEQTDGAS
jgi:hypothetical protein